MENITYEVILVFAIGFILLVIVCFQYRYGKVYTRGSRIKWHEKAFVTKEEAPYHFWIIIGAQFFIGTILVVISAMEFFNRLD